MHVKNAGPQNLLHIPHITRNLISASKFGKDNNVFFEFHPSVFFVRHQVTRSILLQGNLEGGLYAFNIKPPRYKKPKEFFSRFYEVVLSMKIKNIIVPKAVSTNVHTLSNCHNNLAPIVFALVSDSQSPSTTNLWHRWLGQPSSLQVVKSVLDSYNISFSKNKEQFFCTTSLLGKSHKLPFKSLNSTYTKPLELVHAGVWGLALCLSSTNYRYYISFVDSFSHYT